MSTDRRTFLKLLATPAIAAGLPANIATLLATPTRGRTGTIDDVEHIIILMQENRSFDHYFGTMRGVRGFSDPRVMKMPSGDSVWRQPAGSSYVLPFRPPVEDVGMTFLSDPPHGWIDGHNAWNEGRYDRWIANKGLTAMTYHRRRDLPYHHPITAR
jgi:phospholipase C